MNENNENIDNVMNEANKNETTPTMQTPMWTEVTPDEINAEKEMENILTSTKALRPSLQEPSFRKYEPYIYLASIGSYSIDPRKEPVGYKGKGVSRHTFALSLRDAVMAYGKYGYKSKIIPATFQYEDVKIVELENGWVGVVNQRLNRVLSRVEILDIKSNISSI